MRKKILIAFSFFAVLTYAQTGKVGINTTNPKASLDINIAPVNLNTTTPEGILIPRVTRERLIAMGSGNSIETSTMIYVTESTTGTQTGVAINVDKAGFYSYNGSAWIPVSIEPWKSTATGDAALSNTENIYHLGKVAIGTNDPAATLDLTLSDDNYDNGTTTEGIIISRVTRLRLEQITTAIPLGTIVYVEDHNPTSPYNNPLTANVKGPGFYYFNSFNWRMLNPGAINGLSLTSGTNGSATGEIELGGTLTKNTEINSGYNRLTLRSFPQNNPNDLTKDPPMVFASGNFKTRANYISVREIAGFLSTDNNTSTIEINIQPSDYLLIFKPAGILNQPANYTENLDMTPASLVHEGRVICLKNNTTTAVKLTNVENQNFSFSDFTIPGRGTKCYVAVGSDTTPSLRRWYNLN